MRMRKICNMDGTGEVVPRVSLYPFEPKERLIRQGGLDKCAHLERTML